MAYIGNSPENIQRGKRFVYEFKATAGQTVFSGTDLNNQTLDLLEENEMGVYLNGVRLADSDDYTVSGDTLTLVSAASLNDQLTVETQAEIANISSYTRAEADARYINYDGDIVAGDLQISGEVDAGSLIVDTDVLVVDATNNRVGVGTTSPAFVFDIQSGTSDFPLRAMSSDDKAVIIIQDNDTANHIISKDSKMSLGSSSNVVTTNVTISNTGQIGIGTISPGGSLDVTVGSGDVIINKDTMPMITYRNGTGSWYHAGKHPTNNYFVISDGTTGTTNERFVIDNAGRVGIGTTTPPQELSVVGQINIDETDYARVEYARNTTNIWSAGLRTGNNFHIYRESGNGSVEIPNGNVLIGTTDANPVTNNVAGTSLLDGGGTRVSRSGEPGGYNRIGSDGTLINFRKDGATVGKIGTVSGKLVLGGGPSAGSDVTIDDSGNVGIGTTSPNQKLHIYGATPQILLETSDSRGEAWSIRSTNGAPSNTGTLSFRDEAGNSWFDLAQNEGAPITRFYSGAASERMVIRNDGKVGIGTNDVSEARLSVIGAGNGNYNAIQIRSSSSTNGVKGGIVSFGQYDDASTSWTGIGGWDTGTARTIYMGGGGWGTQEATEFRVYTGSYDAGNGNAETRLTVDSTGDVGIGTTSPAAKLHIKTSTIAAGSDLDEIAIIADTPFVSGYQAQSASLLSGFDSTIHGTAIGMVYENPGYALTFFTNDNTSGLPIERLRINDSGNVSIGAGNAPSERLQIGGNFRAGNTGATTSFDGGGNDRYIGVSSLNGGDAMFIAHASGYGVGYFGYEPTDDKLIIACDNGGGNNKIDFSLNAGTNANGATDNLTGVWGDPELRISSTAHMVHVRGDTADTGTTGGSKGLSIYTGGGTSCPIYFGSESNSAQKSMYMTGYWIYLRGHQNEGIRFVFSQGAGNAPRSDQYQFKYNSAYRPTGNTTWDGFSDARAKENVTNLTGALDTISQLRPVTFDWTDDYADTMNMFEMDTTDEKSYNHFSVKENGYDLDRKTSQIGFIAQEFEEVFPKSITETEMQLGDTKVEDFKTVNYDHLIPVLTKAIQELKDENDALKARIEALEG